jgi:hypothetical protein
LVVAATAFLVLVPVVHVAIEIAQIASTGPLVYGTRVNLGQRGLHRLLDAVANMVQSTVSPVGWILLATVPAATTVCLIRRQRVYGEAALTASALAALAWSSQAAVFPSRYYMPTIALLSVALALLLARLTRSALLVAATALSIIAVSVAASYISVRDWSARERQGADLVRTVARLHATGCPIFATGLDPERQQSLPVLVRLRGIQPAGCVGREAFILRGSRPSLTRLSKICAGRETAVGRWRLTGLTVAISRCEAKAPHSSPMAEAHRLL